VQINSGTVNVSLSAERRHEVQQGVEAREAELQKILSATHDLLRKRVGSNAQLRPVTTRLSATQASEAVVPAPVVAHREIEEPGSNDDCVQQNGSTSPHSYASEDVSNLQEKARVLEEQNEYLEIPKESIRILGGKENELGCGKAATVYRGLWLNKNGAAEVRAYRCHQSQVVLLLTVFTLTLGCNQIISICSPHRQDPWRLHHGSCASPKTQAPEHCAVHRRVHGLETDDSYRILLKKEVYDVQSDWNSAEYVV
jgi:hypothetical protein